MIDYLKLGWQFFLGSVLIILLCGMVDQNKKFFHNRNGQVPRIEILDKALEKTQKEQNQNFIDCVEQKRVGFGEYDANVVIAIIGETSGEGRNNDEKFTAMSYVAHAIRNRGNLRGVAGLNAKHVKNEPNWVKVMAIYAWEYSACEKDPTHGSDSWGNKKDIKLKGWTDNKEFRVKYLNHYFYQTQ